MPHKHFLGCESTLDGLNTWLEIHKPEDEGYAAVSGVPDRLARILTVLRLIQSRGQWNAKTIVQELEVTERTAYRDLQALELADVPWYYDVESERTSAFQPEAAPNVSDRR
jgi:hypothetical protein